MVRRWSYIDNSARSNFSDSALSGPGLREAYLKKNFRNNVRSKKVQHSLTKISRKRYSFRKLKNSAIVLLWHASSWAHYNRQSKLLQSKELFFTYFGPPRDSKPGLLLLKAEAVSINANFRFVKPGFIAHGRGLAQNLDVVTLERSKHIFNTMISLPIKLSLSFRRVFTLLTLNSLNKKIDN